MQLKKFRILFLIFAFVFLCLFASAWVYHQKSVKKLKDQLLLEREIYVKQLKEKEEEIGSLLNDSAKFLSSRDVLYSFQNFGIYSPLFLDKTIKEEVYLYKRNLIKKMTIILVKETTNSNVSSEDDSKYLVEVWEYPNLKVITGYENNKIISLDSIRQAWKKENIFKNQYKISFYRTPFDVGSPYFVSLEADIDASPNNKPHFLRIRSAAILDYVGTFSYNPKQSDFLRQVTKNIKEIGETISYIPY